MTLEIASQIASVASAFFALIGLLGLGALVYKFVFKQENKNSLIIHGDVNGDVVAGGVSTSAKFTENKHE